MRLEGLLELFGKDATWGQFFKKATKKQVQEILAEVDDIHGECTSIEDTDFLDLLDKKFPELRKKGRPPAILWQ